MVLRASFISFLESVLEAAVHSVVISSPYETKDAAL